MVPADQKMPRAGFYATIVRPRAYLRIPILLLVLPIYASHKFLSWRIRRYRRNIQFGTRESDEHKQFRHTFIVDATEDPSKPAVDQFPEALNKAYETVKFRGAVMGANMARMLLIWIYKRVFFRPPGALMKSTFFFEKTTDLKRSTGRTFWLRTAQLDDRSLALAATNRIDEILAICIVAKCRLFAEKKAFERVFDGEGPLSRFAHKIAVAHLLGLLVGDMLHDITILRKIRNDFAHDSEFKDFATREISSRCRSLRMHANLVEEIKTMAGTAERQAFLASAVAIAMHLIVVLQHAMSELHIIAKYRAEMNAHTLEKVEGIAKGILSEVASSVTQISP